MYLTRRDPMYNFFNEMFRSPFMSGSNDTVGTTKLMKTDIKEYENGYALDVDLPGFSKENIQAELKDGYLTITASRSENTENKDDNGKVLRRERFQGTCKRSFYVGEYLHEEDIHAEFKDGVLQLNFPKETAPEPEQPKLITIQ
ncbi:MAG: Hsp20/alpha crystallin family protein [Parasporobacterium sp.]|nr:Hsp20/alpha crystallin family protein [Parasporobacterium sp.]